MLKRAISYIWNAEKTQVARSMEYERWSKTQLIEKIRELESRNENETAMTNDNSENNDIKPDEKNNKRLSKNKPKEFDFSKYNKRFIALRFAYVGWDYNGLNFQYEPTPLPTVEEEILKALAKSKLITQVDPACCNFSRCGRTDKGVSAMNQVISLDVRSNLIPEDQLSSSNDDKELPYLAILNSLLPTDIRITAVCLRPPPKFDARFSCSYRHYRYIFRKYDLDLDLMQEGAKRYEGVRDFRNFCKIDGSKQITNYKREVLSANIIHLRDDFYIFDLKGSAFLWHQVRCMMAVLFAVGQKLEAPSIIDDLVDVEKFPGKPSFEMANDVPLVLYDCVFPEMEWLDIQHFKNNTGKIFKDNANMRGLVFDYDVKAHIVEMLQSFSSQDTTNLKSLPGSGHINVGDGVGRNFRKYVPIAKRELAETFELVNSRYTEKKKRKLQLATE